MVQFMVRWGLPFVPALLAMVLADWSALLHAQALAQHAPLVAPVLDVTSQVSNHGTPIVVMIGAATTDVAEFFKYNYGFDRMLQMANEEVVAWRMFSKRKKEVGGRQWLETVVRKRGGVWTGHAEGGSKTTRRIQPDTAEASFDLQEFHGIYDVSWRMLRAASKSEWAFERAIKFMDDNIRARVYRLLNADLISDGLGKLAVMPAADNATTITVNALPSVDLGLYVDVMDASDNNTKLADSVTVDAILESSREITLSGAPAGTAAGDYLVVEDTVATGVSRHTHGLLGIIDDEDPPAPAGDYGGIDRGTAGNEFWESTVLQAGGVLRPLDEDLLLQGHDLQRERGGGGINAYLSNLAILRRYHEQLRSEVFFALSGKVSPLGAGSGLGRAEESMDMGPESEGKTPYSFSGIPWYAEPYFAASTIVGLNRENFWIGHDGTEVPTPLSEIFEDMVPFFNSTTSTTFEVIHYWEGELICDNPRAGVKWEDIAES